MMKSVALLLACLGFMLVTLTLAELDCSSMSAQSKNKLDLLVFYMSRLRAELRKVQGKKKSCSIFIGDLTKEARKKGLIPKTYTGAEGANEIATMLENRARCGQSFFPGPHPLAIHVWHCIDLIGLPNGDLSTNNEADNSKPEAQAIVEVGARTEAVAKERFDEEADSESEALVVSKTKSESQARVEVEERVEAEAKAGVDSDSESEIWFDCDPGPDSDLGFETECKTKAEAKTKTNVRLQAYESENEKLKATNRALGDELNDATRTIGERDETIEKLRSELGQSEAKLNSIVDTNNGNVGELKNCMATLEDLKKSTTESVGLFETKIGELRQKLTAN